MQSNITLSYRDFVNRIVVKPAVSNRFGFLEDGLLNISGGTNSSLYLIRYVDRL